MWRVCNWLVTVSFIVSFAPISHLKKEKIKINYEERFLNITEKNYEIFVYKGVSLP